MAEIKRLYNHGGRSYITSKGALEPKKFLDLPESEAKRLSDAYPHHLKDKQAMFGEETVNTAEVSKLKEEIAVLKEQVAANTAEKAELENLVLAIDTENKEAKGQLVKLQKKISKAA